MSTKTISIDMNTFSLNGSPRSRKGRKGGHKPTLSATSPVNNKHKKDLLNKIKTAIKQSNANASISIIEKTKQNTQHPPRKINTQLPHSPPHPPPNSIIDFSYFDTLKQQKQQRIEQRIENFKTFQETEILPPYLSASLPAPPMVEVLSTPSSLTPSPIHHYLTTPDNASNFQAIETPPSPPQTTPIILETAPYVPTYEKHTEPQTQPPYGILKGGNKPTFRTWKKTHHKHSLNETRKNTLKHKYQQHYIKTHSNHERVLPSLTPTPSTLTPITNTINASNTFSTSDHLLVKKIKKTYTATFNCGKHTKHKISVILSNESKRSDIKKGVNELLGKPISDIKRALKSKNFINGGTLAPNVLLRQMYLDNYLSGGGENINKNKIVENFIVS